MTTVQGMSETVPARAQTFYVIITLCHLHHATFISNETYIRRH